MYAFFLESRSWEVFSSPVFIATRIGQKPGLIHVNKSENARFFPFGLRWEMGVESTAAPLLAHTTGEKKPRSLIAAFVF
jgi:hypothetical protein